MGELALRFVVGGAIVSLFAVCGEVFKPKTFAGIFGAAPSVAIATLALAFATHGADYAATECRSMIVGAIAFIAYGAACVAVLRAQRRLAVWRAAATCWSVWLVSALGLWSILHVAGVLR